MALLYCDSFDHYTDAEVTAKGWNGYGFIGSPGRNGTGGYLVANRSRSLGGNYSTLIAGCAIRTSSYTDNAIGFLDSGTIQIMVVMNISTRSIEVWRGGSLIAQSAANLFNVNQWNYFEIKVTFHSTAGSVTARLNGATIISVSGVNTSMTGNPYANGFATLGTSIHYDDLYICDTSGTEANDFLGDVYVMPLYPDSDDLTGWTPSSGSTRYQCIDETTVNGDSDYIYSNTVNDTFACGLTNLPSSAWSVKAVQLVTAARKDDAGSRVIVPLLRIGTTNYETTQRSLADTYTLYCDQFSTNPATGAAWSVSDVNNLKAGARVVS